MMASLLVLATPLAPHLAPSLTSELASSVALGLTSGSQRQHQLSPSPAPLDEESPPDKVESPTPQPDPKPSIPAPESASSTVWIGWLSIPLLVGWLGWLLTRESTDSRATTTRTVQRQGEIASDRLASDRLALNAHRNILSQSSDLKTPDLRDWVRLTTQSSGDLQVDWQISAARQLALRQQGGRMLMLRLHDITDLNLNHHVAPVVQQYRCSEQSQRMILRPPASDRDYGAELGYLTADGRWLRLVCSAQVADLDAVQPNSQLAVSRQSDSKLGAQVKPQEQDQVKPQLNPEGGSQLAIPFLVRAFNASCNCLTLAIDHCSPTIDC